MFTIFSFRRWSVFCHPLPVLRQLLGPSRPESSPLRNGGSGTAITLRSTGTAFRSRSQPLRSIPRIILPRAESHFRVEVQMRAAMGWILSATGKNQRGELGSLASRSHSFFLQSVVADEPLGPSTKPASRSPCWSCDSDQKQGIGARRWHASEDP